MHLPEIRDTLIIHSEEHGIGMTLPVSEGEHNTDTKKNKEKTAHCFSFVPEFENDSDY